MKDAINIGSRRELFWDDFMIEPELTTAVPKLHGPVKKEMVLHLDKPWEGDGCDYYNIFKDDDVYRMYYLGWWMLNPEQTEHTGEGIKVCYAESKDGLNWYRPNLGIFEFQGSKENNIILDRSIDIYDNFYAFKDTNPDCRPGEKYKAVAESGKDGTLWGYYSEDAVHWTRSHLIGTREMGKYDSLNTCFWDETTEQYWCYIRDFHDNDDTGEYGIRDIRYITSKDFLTWTMPVMLDYCGGEDYPLYTNNISRYFRAPHVWTGFPTRYVQRNKWTKNFDSLCGKERRQKRCAITPRLGQTVTDTVFMSSRDGMHWNRFDEAWLTPGPENGYNWVYGDCFPALGMIQTPSEYPGASDEISMYNFEGKWSCMPSKLFRYTVRLDGFASYNSPYKESKLVTRPFIFEGKDLLLNFRTSARGHIYIKVLDEDCNPIDGLYTCEMFGDRVDTKIEFEKAEISSVAGKPIRLEFTMSDADVFSFKFE